MKREDRNKGITINGFLPMRSINGPEIIWPIRLVNDPLLSRILTKKVDAPKAMAKGVKIGNWICKLNDIKKRTK
ncbi:hypothetical protein GCM10011391_10760 [Pullulanibacillus camelliae]|uniref:Uncharacterized protein n=1 Tax=Pullulanibacillus camelliae TaxID=1707096 RepID=A0A8J2YDG3_9BACL|nr:hypothetical protein GCM10011391_10760 [Pullulanibacillus camelliae]